MTTDEYLEGILRDQTFAPESPELAELRKHREDVRSLLRRGFGSSPSINEAGSKKKGTMIKESYDLDMTCYFPHDDDTVGKSLQEIYDNVEEALQDDYYTERKGSAIRLWDLEGEADFHVDVVPGRYVDGKAGDVYLHRTSGDKQRLKTNLDVHVAHVKGSGVVDAIKLMKYWRERESLEFKTFVLELAVIRLLEEKYEEPLSEQLSHVWTQLRDHADSITIEDPANPGGNDLSDLIDPVRDSLSQAADGTLETIEADGWQAVFGELEDDGGERTEALRRIAVASTVRSKPWSHG